jgi:hypothetical protein
MHMLRTFCFSHNRKRLSQQCEKMIHSRRRKEKKKLATLSTYNKRYLPINNEYQHIEQPISLHLSLYSIFLIERKKAINKR